MWLREVVMSYEHDEKSKVLIERLLLDPHPRSCQIIAYNLGL